MQKSALRNRNYLLFLAGNTVSLHGLWVYRVALGWHAWQLTQSELWVGVVAFTQFFPILLFAPLFGAFADRFDRKRSTLAINAISTVIMALLAACTASGLIGIYGLCGFSLAQGIAEGAHTPMRLALVPNLVPPEQLQSAMAMNSIAFNVSRFIGPALAGVLIAVFGAAAAFAFNAVSYLPVLVALVCIRVAPLAAPRASRRLGADIAAGLRYAAAHGPVRNLMALVALASLFGRGPLELLPAFAESMFGRGSTGLATLTSAAGAGAVLAGIVLSRGLIELGIPRIALGTAVAGALIAALGLAPSFWSGVAAVTALGFMLTFCGVGAQILLQSLIEDELRGRVSSLWGMLAFGGTAFGGLVAGAAADRFGLASTAVAAGGACVLLAASLARRRRRAAGRRAAVLSSIRTDPGDDTDGRD
ncbi:MAG TPA: MFS transporter [Woeseiaceae bacterium]